MAEFNNKTAFNSTEEYENYTSLNRGNSIDFYRYEDYSLPKSNCIDFNRDGDYVWSVRPHVSERTHHSVLRIDEDSDLEEVEIRDNVVCKKCMYDRFMDIKGVRKVLKEFDMKDVSSLRKYYNCDCDLKDDVFVEMDDCLIDIEGVGKLIDVCDDINGKVMKEVLSIFEHQAFGMEEAATSIGKDLRESVSVLGESFTSTTDKLTNALSQSVTVLSDAFLRMTNNGSALTDAAKTLSTGLVNASKDINVKFGLSNTTIVLVVGSIVIIGIVHMIKPTLTKWVLGAIGSAAVALGFSKYMDFNIDTIDLQAGEAGGDEELLEASSKLLYNIVSAKVSFDGAESNWEKCYRFLKSPEAGFVRTKNFLQSLVDGFKRIVAWMCRNVFKVELPSWMQSRASTYCSWVDDVTRLSDDYKKGELAMTVDNYKKIVALKTIGADLAKSFALHVGNSSMSAGVVAANNVLNTLYGVFAPLEHPHNNLRVRPLCVSLAGGAGIGKSLLVPLLSNALLARVFEKEKLIELIEDPSSARFSWDPSVEFHDSYRGQPHIWVDDWDASSEDKGNNRFLIDIVNNAPYVVEMADVNKKGTQYARPTAVFVTTNNGTFLPNDVRCPAAFLRRMHLKLHVFVADEYAKRVNGVLPDRMERVIDMDKVKDSTLNTDIWKFKVMNFERNTLVQIGDVLTFDQLVVKCREMYDKIVQTDLGMMKSIEAISKAKFAAEEVEKDDSKKESSSSGIEQQGGEEPERISRGFSIKEFIDTEGNEVAPAVYHVVVDKILKKIKARSVKLPLDETKGKEKDDGEEVFHDAADTIYTKFNVVNVDKRIDVREIIDDVCTEEGVIYQPYQSVRDLLKVENIMKVVGFHTRKGMAYVKDYVSSFKEKHSACYALLSIVSIVSIVGGLAVGLYTLIKSIGGFEAQSGHVKLKPRKQTVISVVSRGGTFNTSTEGVEFQSSNPNVEVFKAIADNFYKLLVRKADGSIVALGHTIALGGKTFVLQAHYYPILSEMRECTFKVVPLGSTWDTVGQYTGGFSGAVFSKEPTEEQYAIDLWPVELPLRDHRNIRNYLLTREEVYAKLSNGAIQGLLFSSSMPNLVVDETSVSLLTERIDVKKTSLAFGVKYDVPTRRGDCGSVLMINEPGNNLGKILSLHIAARTGHSPYAIGSVLTKEWFDSVVTHYEQNIGPPEGVGSIGETFLDVEVIGELKNFTSNGDKNNIVPTKFVETKPFGEITTAPAVIGKVTVGDKVIDPFEISLKTYSGPDVIVDKDYLGRAIHDYKTKVLATVRPEPLVGKRILSNEEAVAGVEGSTYVRRLNMNTSTGIPWVNDKKIGVKKMIFGNGEELDLTSPKALEVFKASDEIIESCRKRVRKLIVFKDESKRETRPLAKVEAFKTRRFSCSPLPYTIAFRRYFGAFISAMMYSRLHNGIAPGINPFTEWSELKKFVSLKGDKVIAGDFSGFDGSQPSCVLKALGEIAFAFYDDGEENLQIRRMLWAEVYNSVHAHNMILIILSHCLASGHPGTTIINSMFINVIMRVVYMMAKGNVECINEFSDNVIVEAFGDDHILNVSDDVIDWFNYQTIQENLKKIGMTYTDENKSAVLPKYKKLEEVTFLKRAFVNRNGRWYAPLSLDTILQMHYFRSVSNNVTEVEQMEQIGCAALRELSLHDDQTWKKWSEVIYTNYAQTYGIRFPYKRKEEWVEEANEDWKFTFGIEQQVGEDVISQAHPTSGSDSSAMGTTTIADDTTVAFNVNTKTITSVPRDLMAGSTGYTNTQTAHYLENGVIMGNYTWGAATAVNSVLCSYSVPFDPAFAVLTANWKKKLHGMMGFKATCVIKFSTSANNMTSGQLLAHCLPFDTLMTNETALRNASLTTKSQQPCVMFDINKQSSCEIRVPYVSPSLFYNLTDGTGSWGTVYLTVWTPLRNASSSSISVSMMVSFTDIEIAMPTTIEPQCASQLNGNNGEATNTDDHDLYLGLGYDPACSNMTQACDVCLEHNMPGHSRLNECLAHKCCWILIPFFWIWLSMTLASLAFTVWAFSRLFYELFGVRQRDGIEHQIGNDVVGKDPGDVEAKKNGVGAISSGISAIGGGVSNVLSKVPVLNTFAKPVEWMTEVGAGIAKIFGFSKPRNSGPIARTILSSNGYSLTTDGFSVAVPMGFLSDFKSEHSGEFDSSNVDQMAFAYIVGRSAFITAVTWSTSAVYQTILWSTLLKPSAFVINSTVAGKVFTDFAPVAYVGSFFKLWSGGFKVFLDFSKTQFHSGRIQITYIPFGAVPTSNLDNEDLSMRTIVDLRETSSLIVNVPYMAVTPYLRADEAMGILMVSVVTPLSITGTVSNTIDMTVRVAGDEHMRFAGLADQIPTVVSQVEPESFEVIQQIGEIDQQVGDHGIADLPVQTKEINIGGVTNLHDNGAKEAYCSGDCIISFRSLLKRRCRILGPTSRTTTSGKSITIRPYEIGGGYYNGSSYVLSRVARDLYSAVGACYLYNRGSIEVEVSGLSLFWSNCGMSTLSIIKGTGLPIYATSAAPLENAHSSIEEYIGNINSKFSVALPSWQATATCLNRVRYLDSAPTDDDIFSRDVALVVSTTNSVDLDKINFYRSIGDDFSFGYFIGVPRMSLSTSLVDF